MCTTAVHQDLRARFQGHVGVPGIQQVLLVVLNLHRMCLLMVRTGGVMRHMLVALSIAGWYLLGALVGETLGAWGLLSILKIHFIYSYHFEL